MSKRIINEEKLKKVGGGTGNTEDEIARWWKAHGNTINRELASKGSELARIIFSVTYNCDRTYIKTVADFKRVLKEYGVDADRLM